MSEDTKTSANVQRVLDVLEALTGYAHTGAKSL